MEIIFRNDGLFPECRFPVQILTYTEQKANAGFFHPQVRRPGGAPGHRIDAPRPRRLSPQPSPGLSLIYPATWIRAAILWGFGVRLWPVVFLAQFALSYSKNGFQWIPFFVATNELMVTALFCRVMQRFRVSREVDRLRDLGIFTLGALVSTA